MVLTLKYIIRLTGNNNSIRFTTTDTIRVLQTLANPETIIKSDIPKIEYVSNGKDSTGGAKKQKQPTIKKSKEEEKEIVTITLRRRWKCRNNVKGRNI